jgi:hypothetical protein
MKAFLNVLVKLAAGRSCAVGKVALDFGSDGWYMLINHLKNNVNM